MNRVVLNLSNSAISQGPLPSGEWANSMRDHYWRNGNYRSSDIIRLLGSVNTQEGIPVTLQPVAGSSIADLFGTDTVIPRR